MARTVKPTFKQWIPGSGRSTGGTPVQGKTRTVGRVSVTSYTTGGVDLKPADVGLSSIDYIQVNVVEGVSSADQKVTRHAAYSQSAQQFYLFTSDKDGDKTAYAAAATEEVSFVAEGDSAMDVELL